MRSLGILALLVGLATGTPAVASDPGMEQAALFIMLHPRTVKEGDQYVFQLGRPDLLTTYRYTPELGENQAMMEIDVRAVFRNDAGRTVVCDNKVFDRGLLGQIGPRDGMTMCVGAFGFAAISSSIRTEMYQAALKDLHDFAMLEHFHGNLGAAPEQSPDDQAETEEEEEAPPAPGDAI